MRASYCYYLTYLAEACLAAGHLDAGLAAVDESLGLCAMLTARFHEANAWRLRGELLRAKGEAREAEATFRQALEIARRQRARAYELRAATGLARLLAGQGRPREALEVLPDVYAGLAEGRDTADLRAARAILDELG
jgi:adenylate cyclase